MAHVCVSLDIKKQEKAGNGKEYKLFDKFRVTNLTQAGLKAMEALAKLEEQRGNPEYAQAGSRPPMTRTSAGKMPGVTGRDRRASSEMCNFLILNISSLQLIPVNMIAYRSQYGSVNPAGIIAPAIAATAVSTVVAIIFCKVMDGKM